MGAGQSTPAITPHGTHPPTRALHILRVTPASPASFTNIEPFFDFVVGLAGASVAPDALELERIVESHEGKTLGLLVWNSKSLETRVVNIVPSRTWALPATPNPNSNSKEQPSLLGLSMRLCEPEFAIDNVWHVLDVLEGSPAESAGLVPYGDWIIGWSGGVLGAEGDFYDVVEAHIDKPLRVYVYSYDFDAIREVVLVPNRQWGGEGLLGCVFGFGLLHRIPPVQEHREPGSLPPELLVDGQGSSNEYEEQELFVPADAEGAHDHEHGHEHGRYEDEYDYASPNFTGGQDYSYSYSNRGASFQAGTIPEEEYEEGERSRSHSSRSSHSSHSHSSHSSHSHSAHGHDHHHHDHDHDHDHHHDHDLDHDHDHDHDHAHHNHNHTPTPPRGIYSNGVPFNGVRRTSLADLGRHANFRREDEGDGGDEESEETEGESEHDGSLTSVE